MQRGLKGRGRGLQDQPLAQERADPWWLWELVCTGLRSEREERIGRHPGVDRAWNGMEGKGSLRAAPTEDWLRWGDLNPWLMPHQEDSARKNPSPQAWVMAK